MWASLPKDNPTHGGEAEEERETYLGTSELPWRVMIPDMCHLTEGAESCCFFDFLDL